MSTEHAAGKGEKYDDTMPDTSSKTATSSESSFKVDVKKI